MKYFKSKTNSFFYMKREDGRVTAIQPTTQFMSVWSMETATNDPYIEITGKEFKKQFALTLASILEFNITDETIN